MKKLLLVAFFVPFVCLLAWVGFLYYQTEAGQEVKVAVRGYDPRDLLSGHYIRFEIDWDKTDCAQFQGGVCPRNEFCKQGRWGRECRFYVPEKYARQLDRLFWRRNDSDLVFEVVYSYIPHTSAIAKKMLINGQDWREFIETPEARKYSY